MKQISTCFFIVIAAIAVFTLIGTPTFAADATVAPKQNGQVLAFRAAEPKPDVNREAFEKFAADLYAPTWKQHAPGMKCFLIKGERGEGKGKYIDVWAFDSIQTRDFYFPQEGGGTSELGGKLLSALPDFGDHWAKYFKEPEENIYTDYILIK